MLLLIPELASIPTKEAHRHGLVEACDPGPLCCLFLLLGDFAGRAKMFDANQVSRINEQRWTLRRPPRSSSACLGCRGRNWRKTSRSRWSSAP